MTAPRQPGEQRHRMTGRKRPERHTISDPSGDFFLLQASVVLCSCAASMWAALQVFLYRLSEPAMVIIPLLYPLLTWGSVFYERFWFVLSHRRLPQKETISFQPCLGASLSFRSFSIYRIAELQPLPQVVLLLPLSLFAHVPHRARSCPSLSSPSRRQATTQTVSLLGSGTPERCMHFTCVIADGIWRISAFRRGAWMVCGVSVHSHGHPAGPSQAGWLHCAIRGDGFRFVRTRGGDEGDRQKG